MQKGTRGLPAALSKVLLVSGLLFLSGCGSGGSGGGDSSNVSRASADSPTNTPEPTGSPTNNPPPTGSPANTPEPTGSPTYNPPSAGATGNTPPSIGGNPPLSAGVGDAYAFNPQASDSDGDSLTFSVTNKPAWASFNASSGRLSGTPRAGDEGTYNNIRITASDGTAADSISFSVTVTSISTGSATLSWIPPQQNTDGSALTDLAGYRIYYGTESQNYPNRIEINNAGLTTYVVENLSPDTYFFAATAVNAAGVESDFSRETVKAVN